MMTRAILPFVLLLIAARGGIARGGIGTVGGGELWDNGCSVIVARVERVGRYDRSGPSTHWAVLAPAAALAGTFDPGLRPTLRVDFDANELNTSIKDVPRDGDLVIAVIHPDAVIGEGRDERRTNFVDSNYCEFMPGNSGMVVVKGLDDPKVAETLGKIQAARKKYEALTRPSAPQSAAPEGPATQPAKE